MNALLSASRGLQPLVDAPVWAVVLLKITAILAAARDLVMEPLAESPSVIKMVVSARRSSSESK